MRNKIFALLKDRSDMFSNMYKDGQLQNSIIATINVLTECLKSGGKIIACGNGGSAAEAMHLQSELVGRCAKTRPGWNCISLTENPMTITAIANDFGYANVFSRQLEAVAMSNDVLFAISTSGASTNVLNAMRLAKARNIKIVGLSNDDPENHMKALSDVFIGTPTSDTARVQEAHLMVIHILCYLLEDFVI